MPGLVARIRTYGAGAGQGLKTFSGMSYLKDVPRRAWAVVEELPATVPIGVAAFGSVAMCCLVLGRFYTWLVLPLGLLAAYAAMRYTQRVSRRVKRPGSPKERRALDRIVVLGILLWLFGNIPFASQQIFTDRDPATYAVAGAWLVNHDNLHITKNPAFGSIPQIAPGSGSGFGVDLNNPIGIYAQGEHLLPALLGLAGRLAGYQAMLRLNILFGATALLAVYGFGRLIMKPRWAAIAIAALSISLPLIYFARDTYTEPLALTFIFSCLMFLWYAYQTRRLGTWLLAGVALGATSLARIDAFVTVAAVEAALVIKFCLASKKEQAAQLRGIALLAVSTALLGTLAWLDLTRLSSGYYNNLRPLYWMQLYVVFAGAVIGTGVVVIHQKTNFIAYLNRGTRRWRSTLLTILLSLFWLCLAVRPFFYLKQMLRGPDTPLGDFTTLAPYWVLWYLPALTILAFVSLFWTWDRVLRGKMLDLLPLLLVVSAECALYFIRPSITPDQIWAARRFLPVVFPGFALLGCLLLARLYDLKWLAIYKQKINTQVVVSSAATLAVISPLFVSYPFIPGRVYASQLTQVEAVCNNIPSNAAVVWVGATQHTMVEPTQAFCGVPAFATTVTDGPTLQPLLVQLAAIGKSQHREVIIAISSGDLDELPVQDQGSMQAVSTITYSSIQQVYDKFPRYRNTTTQTVMLGKLNDSGEVVSIDN